MTGGVNHPPRGMVAMQRFIAELSNLVDNPEFERSSHQLLTERQSRGLVQIAEPCESTGGQCGHAVSFHPASIATTGPNGSGQDQS